MISFVVPPVTVPVPVLIVPAAPSNLTAFAPPVVNVLFTPSITEEPIVALPAVIVLLFVPSTVTPPILAVLPVIVPVAPFNVTGLAPPVVNVYLHHQ